MACTQRTVYTQAHCTVIRDDISLNEKPIKIGCYDK